MSRKFAVRLKNSPARKVHGDGEVLFRRFWSVPIAEGYIQGRIDALNDACKRGLLGSFSTRNNYEIVEVVPSGESFVPLSDYCEDE